MGNTIYKLTEEDFRTVCEDRFPDMDVHEIDNIIQIAHDRFELHDWVSEVEAFIEAWSVNGRITLSAHNVDTGEMLSVTLPRARAITTLGRAVRNREDFMMASEVKYYIGYSTSDDYNSVDEDTLDEILLAIKEG